MKANRIDKLKRLLEPLITERRETVLQQDPFRTLGAYTHPKDYELMALLACLLDFGAPVEREESKRKLFNRLGDKPARTLARANRSMLKEVSQDLAFSFLEDQDVLLLLHVLRQTFKQHGGLAELYIYSASGGRDKRQPLHNLERFMLRLSKPLEREERARPGLAHLLPRPAKGSAVRRLHLYLRHMVRSKEQGDSGLWTQPKAQELQFPLSKEQHKMLLQLKLCTRQICNRGAVAEVSSTLALLDARDPIRYSLAFELLEAQNPSSEELNQAFRLA